MESGNEILLVNRDKAFLDYLVGILKPAGYSVQTAVCMRSALAALSAQSVALIVCGKDLEDVGGYDFLRFLKSDPLRQNIPVMFVVSIKEQGRPKAAFDLGAVDFLVFPVEPQELTGRIDEALKGSAGKGVPPPASQPQPQTKKVFAETSGEMAGIEKRLPDTVVEVSRDGIIWLSGVAKRFGPQQLFVETALFGKVGVRLMLRFRLEAGMFIAHGHIAAMSCDDFQKPAGLSLTMEAADSWCRIHADLEKICAGGPDVPTNASGAASAAAVEKIQKTIVLRRSPEDRQDISGAQLIQAAEEKKKFYDIRFYYSLIGKQLDNYRAITLIGSGMMGGVLQGWDVSLEREVALKIISFELSSKQEFRDMFIKEARVISRLNHPNIAQIYSIGSSDEILYYAMEFIEGETLKDLLDRENTISSLKGLDYLLTICETLEFIDHSGIVHRDIKPANIMISNQGIIKLVDFGVARARDTKASGSLMDMVMGTPLYMSPEQIAGLTLDRRSDMYSLGATFYHALAGVPPFESEDFKEILDHHLKTPAVALRERNPKAAPALCKIIEKMLAKEPDDRYKDFQSIVTELKALRSRVAEARRAS